MTENSGKIKKRAVNPTGPTGKQVAANVARLRGGMQYKELAEKLTEVGRPIAPLGLRRIESGERKVDVDDLMAFAVVFDVSPLTLLLPPNGSKSVTERITGCDHELGCNVIWSWATGREPLAVPKTHAAYDRAVAEYQGRAIPRPIESRAAPSVAIATNFLDADMMALLRRRDLSHHWPDSSIAEAAGNEPLDASEEATLNQALSRAGDAAREYYVAQNYSEEL